MPQAGTLISYKTELVQKVGTLTKHKSKLYARNEIGFSLDKAFYTYNSRHETEYHSMFTNLKNWVGDPSPKLMLTQHSTHSDCISSSNPRSSPGLIVEFPVSLKLSADAVATSCITRGSDMEMELSAFCAVTVTL